MCFKIGQKIVCLDMHSGFAPSHRFLNNDTHGCMDIRKKQIPKVLKQMKVTMKIACLSHSRWVKRLVNPGHCAYNTVGCGVSPWKQSKYGEREGTSKRNGRRAAFPASPSVNDLF